MPRLSDADVTEIRRMRAAGATLRAIGIRFAISHSHVKSILDGRIHRRPPGVLPVAEARRRLDEAIEVFAASVAAAGLPPRDDVPDDEPIG